jgi:UDP-3-O-[3-hydroxymyristoyl] glucosamine N-acyltransferase
VVRAEGPLNLFGRFRQLGVRGCLKTLYYSSRYTDSATALAFHSNVVTAISPETNFDINRRLSVGICNMGSSHPRAARSVFTTTTGSSVSHTGTESATIGPGSTVHVEGDFSMGDSYLNSNGRIICGERITIGDDTAIAWNVDLLDDDRHSMDSSPRSAPIRIGDHVWIGHDVTVNKGVTIGDGAIVASNSVVTSDVPERTLVAGIPAEPIREAVSWE